ncbi:MAG: hypothetical protein QOF54_263 [Solirubrobacteraceae bacterium]|jgi:hypothetical protein|nr:hypothetical protein [Solirubrobacteraceae bacterium]
MSLKVVGAGVGRTGTNSLKLALEKLLDGRCHHMLEVIGDAPTQVPGWTEAIDGRDVDWQELLGDYVAQVDWPGASFWRELSAANPDALVVLSTRDADGWYRSASNTIFNVFENPPPGLERWFKDAVPKMFRERFCDELGNRAAMIDAFERHNAEVRAGVPADRLLEWTPADGWGPICERLGVAVPGDPFPLTNTTQEMRERLGLPPLAQAGEPALG